MIFFQGNFLAINSDPSTVGRNAGLFWALYQMSGVLGNAFVLVFFNAVSVIDPDTRWKVAWALTGMCLAGQAVVLLLRPTPWVQGNKGQRYRGKQNSSQLCPGKRANPWQSLLSSLRLLRTRDMMLLCLSFIYSGLEVSFWAGAFPSAVSFTLGLGAMRKMVMGLCSIMVPLGSMVGGLLLILFRERVNRIGRSPILCLGLIFHSTGFLLCLLFLPHLAPFGDTDKEAFLQTRWTLVFHYYFMFILHSELNLWW